MLKTKLLNSSSSFSKRQMTIFAVLFAVIGGFFLYRTFAAGPLVASLEAEQMTLPGGGSVIADANASSGKAVKLRGSGVIQGLVSLPSSLTSFDIVAKANKCHGKWPSMRVELSGVQLISTVVSSNSWKTYSANTNAASGSRNVYVSYTGGSDCTTTLYLDVSRFYGPTNEVTPPPTISLSATPSSVSPGSPATLTWNSANATSCTASGAWSGFQPTSGSTSTGALNNTSTYSLGCTGSGGDANASTTVTVTTATPPPPPPPPSGTNYDPRNGGRLFSILASWNQRIPLNPALSPNNSAQINKIVELVNARGWPMGTRAYTAATYFVDSSTPKRTVYTVEGGPLYNVPIPNEIYLPQDVPLLDVSLVTVDLQRGCVWDMGGVKLRTTDSNLDTQYAWNYKVDSPGWSQYSGTPSASGSAFPGGLIFPEEIKAGRIDHALRFKYPFHRVSGRVGGQGSWGQAPVDPANSSDMWGPSLTTYSGVSGYSGSEESYTIPEGGRIQLDPNLNLDTFQPALNRWQKIVARALQEYGAYFVDYGGNFAFDFNSRMAYQNDPYVASDVLGTSDDYVYMPNELAKYLRSLASGPQKTPVWNPAGNRDPACS